MAYMDQEKKKALAPEIKKVCKKYNMKCTIGVRHHSTLVVNIPSGSLDILEQSNIHRKKYRRPESGEFTPSTHIDVGGDLDRVYTGNVLSFLKELTTAANKGNFDKSDIMSDYFHVGWCVDINVGQWDKPYRLEK